MVRQKYCLVAHGINVSRNELSIISFSYFYFSYQSLLEKEKKNKKGNELKAFTEIFYEKGNELEIFDKMPFSAAVIYHFYLLCFKKARKKGNC